MVEVDCNTLMSVKKVSSDPASAPWGPMRSTSSVDTS